MTRWALLVLVAGCAGSKDDGGPATGDDPTGVTDTDTDGGTTDDPTDPPFDADRDGFTVEEGDCDDADAAVHPGADELCNGADDDCDLDVDEDAVDAVLAYTDADGDGFGDDATEARICDAGGRAPTGGDCDDAEATVYPGAPEIACDGLDQDCDPATFEAGAVLLDGAAVADLPTAVAAASDGAEITLCEGRYDVPELEIGRTLTITGLGTSDATVIRGAKGAVLRPRQGTTTLAHLTITGGRGHDAGGGDTEGGGLRIDPGVAVYLDDVVVTGNSAGFGAGVWLGQGSILDLQGSSVAGNTGDPKGAIIDEGGGIYAESGTVVTLDASHVDGNVAGLCGGISLREDGEVTGSNGSTVSDNATSSLQGGGICAWTFSDVRGVEIARNASLNIAGGIYAAHGIELTDVSLLDNVAGLDGGGIDVTGDATLLRVVLDGNEAGIDGGAIAAGFETTVTITDSTVTTNLATFFAALTGGVLLDDAMLISVNTDWGDAATDNAPSDVGLSRSNQAFAFPGVMDFTCVDGGGCQ